MATLLDSADHAVGSATQSAQITLARLGARPFLERLDQVLADRRHALAPSRPAAPQRTPAG